MPNWPTLLILGGIVLFLWLIEQMSQTVSVTEEEVETVLSFSVWKSIDEIVRNLAMRKGLRFHSISEASVTEHLRSLLQQGSTERRIRRPLLGEVELRTFPPVLEFRLCSDDRDEEGEELIPEFLDKPKFDESLVLS